VRACHPVLRPFAVLAIAVVAGMLAGCAAAPASAPSDARPEAGKGIVLVRASVEGLKYVTGFALHARPVGGKEAVTFQGWGTGSDGYWSTYYDEVEKGELVAASLPAGDYEFFTFHAVAGAWGGMRTVHPQRDFSFRFRVNAAETVYLGNLLVRFSGDKGTLARTAGQVQVEGQRTIPFDLIARDTRSRDFPEIGKRVPGLAPEGVQVRLLK
jgi:hypothetical protein